MCISPSCPWHPEKPKWYHWKGEGTAWNWMLTGNCKWWNVDCWHHIPFILTCCRIANDQGGDQMSFQSSPQTPRTHLILCLVLSAMLLLTFIFLLTLAIITPSWSPSFLHSLPTELFLRGDPVMGSGFALCLAGSPLSYIRWLTLVSLSPTRLMPDSAQHSTPRSGKWQQILPFPKWSRKTLCQNSHTQCRYPRCLNVI